jgi:hypothetical protein
MRFKIAALSLLIAIPCVCVNLVCANPVTRIGCGCPATRNVRVLGAFAGSSQSDKGDKDKGDKDKSDKDKSGPDRGPAGKDSGGGGNGGPKGGGGGNTPKDKDKPKS